AVTTAAAPLPAWVWWLPLAGAVAALVLVLTGRRRTTAPAPDPERAGLPLEITGLSKRYARSADRYAVRDLSFRVERGQVLGLLGPNGAGKTTTLRMLMGDRKSTRLNSSHVKISYAVFCLKKKKHT